jgi:hypothetical protein
MDFYKKEHAKSKDSRKDFRVKKLIIKKEAKVYVYDEYIILKVNKSELIFGLRYIQEIYINVTNKIPLNELFKLAKKKKIYLIDRFGYLVGEIKCKN